MKKKILTVDDSASLRHMISFTLRSAGYEVSEAEDGQDGLEKAKTKQFDLILTDQNMVKMNGLNLIERLRTLPMYKSIPILMLTTESTDAIKLKVKEAGATGWLAKPFDPQKLLDVIRKVI